MKGKITSIKKEKTHSQSGECVFDCSRALVDLSLKMKTQLLTILVQKDEIIPYDTFIFNSNNFFLYFSDGFVGKIKRESLYFKDFLQSEIGKELDNTLTKEVKNLCDSKKRLLLYGIQCDENINLVKNDGEFSHFLSLLYTAYLEFKKLRVSNGELLGFNA